MINFKPFILDIEKQINEFKKEKKKLFISSSFQTNSIVLLHIISNIDNAIPVYFINTGFLFSETFDYKKTIIDSLNLNVITIESDIPKSEQLSNKNEYLYEKEPDKCCHINKVLPLKNIIKEYDVWINGIRASQSKVRRDMKEIQETKDGILRYHPILNWNSKMVYYYIKENNLPKHPLEEEGYLSIGCKPCTIKCDGDLDDRSGRWSGSEKTECGLHTTLGKK